MQVEQIPLTKIVSSKTNPRKHFHDQSLEELATSIKKNGLIHPINVRKKGKKFEVISGERRYRASKLAKIKTIDAIVRELDDDKAFDMQVVENLQREDVHPIHEANGFQQMLDTGRYKIETIAETIGRSESFVTKRLQLNSMIDQMQEAFFNHKMNLVSAMEISRVSADDQLAMYRKHYEKDRENYPTTSAVRMIIGRDILRQLAKAPFDPEDAELNPTAGPCTTCPYRSGNNPLLFDDIEENDVCFNHSCYEVKQTLQFDIDLEKAKDDPDIFLLASHYGSEDELVTDLKKQGHRVLEQYEDFRTYHDSVPKKAKKGFWVMGFNKGEYSDIALLERAKAKMENEPDSPEAQIEKIESREERAIELDREKIYRQLPDVMAECEIMNQVKTIQAEDEYLILLTISSVLFDDLPWGTKKRFYTEIYPEAEKDEDGYADIYPNEVEYLKRLSDLMPSTEELMEWIRGLTRTLVLETFFSGSYQDPESYSRAYLYQGYAEIHETEKFNELKAAQDKKAKDRAKKVKAKLKKLKSELKKK